MSLSGRDSDRPVLVTGASGFIGSRVVRELVRRDVHRIAGERRFDGRAHSAASARPAEPARGVTIVECDVLNRHAITRLIEAHRPIACVHAAWNVSHPNYLVDPSNHAWAQASLHLAQVLQRHGCQWFGACGTHIEPARGCAPPNRYAAAKSTFRHRLFDLASDLGQMTICWWRIFQPYGTGERPHRLLPSMLEAFARGERFTVCQPHAQRDFIHADDVAKAIDRSLSHRAGGVFDVGSGSTSHILGVAQRLAQLCSAEHLLDVSSEADFVVTPPPAAADVAPLTHITGWEPQISLNEGLRTLAATGIRGSRPMRATA